jgi:hypothetical protein
MLALAKNSQFVTSGVDQMRCTACDGTGIKPHLAPIEASGPCSKCDGTGTVPDDEYEAKLREATAKIGMVYFVRDDTNGRIKIGTSLNPLDRLRELQTGSSFRLRLMAMTGGGRKSERHLHETFADRRIAGEWFDDRDREITRMVLWALSGDNSIIWPDK